MAEKFCPLRYMTAMILLTHGGRHKKGERPENCIGEGCAWWVTRFKRCAIALCPPVSVVAEEQ